MRAFRRLSALRAVPAVVWGVFATTLVNRFGTMALTFLAIWLPRYGGFSVPEAGACVTLYGAGSLVAMILAGPTCVRFGAASTVLISLLGSGVALTFFPLFHSAPLVYLLCFVWAMFAEAYRPASLTMVSDVALAGDSKMSFAVLRLATNIGMMAGSVVGGVLLSVSRSAIFIVDAITSFAAAAVFMVVAKRLGLIRMNPRRELPLWQLRSSQVLQDRKFLLYLIALLPLQLVMVQHKAALPHFLTDHLGFPAAFFGLLVLVNTLVIMVAEVPLSMASAHWPNRYGIAAGAMLFGAGFGLLGLVRSRLGVLMAVLIFTAGEMLAAPAAAAYVADRGRGENAGVYMSLYQLGFGVALTIGPALGIVLLETAGPGVLWSVTLVAGLFSAVAVWLLLREAHSPHSRASNQSGSISRDGRTPATSKSKFGLYP